MYDILAVLGTAGMLAFMVIMMGIAGAISGRNAHVNRKAAR